VKGTDLRGRSRVLLAFRRPDAMRVEIPGPAGARLVAVARQGHLTAVLPADRAFLETPASAEELESLLGVALTPAELMDVLVGKAPPGLREYEASWGDTLPRRVQAVLADGTRLDARVDDAEKDVELPEAAFEPPPHPGYRSVSADEARRLLGGRWLGRSSACGSPTRAPSGPLAPRASFPLRPPMRALRLRSYAKINLGLEVLAPREDGYHELRTLFQTIDLHDDVVLRPRARGVVIRCEHPHVPRDGTNLAARAAEALRAYARVKEGVEIEIRKRIPVGGGLGGGSSNAASVLLGLDRMWRTGLEPAELHRLARRLGADVPYFLLGGTALGLARGDEVYSLRRQLRAHVVVVDPGIHVSTARVFGRLDAALTPRENSTSIFYFVSRELEGSGAFRVLVNDLEEAALEEAPALRERARRIRAVLLGQGSYRAALSGSGGSYFGLFESRRRAERARAALAAEDFQALSARTLTIEQYRAAWGRAPAR
jgi:4-diphosphocytidyl-2-C-methyl-D-erythritol kinase